MHDKLDSSEYSVLDHVGFVPLTNKAWKSFFFLKLVYIYKVLFDLMVILDYL